MPASWGAEPTSGWPSHPGEKTYLAPPVFDSIQPNTCLSTRVATIAIAHRGARPRVAWLAWLLRSSAHSSKATPPRSSSRPRRRVQLRRRQVLRLIPSPPSTSLPHPLPSIPFSSSLFPLARVPRAMAVAVAAATTTIATPSQHRFGSSTYTPPLHPILPPPFC
jgi:hypothetical protein